MTTALALTAPATLTVDAKKLNEAIELEAAGAAFDEARLERRYGRLGSLLALMKRTESWRSLQVTSFPRYLLNVAEKYGRSPQRLWVYVQVAETWLPLVGEAGMDKIGVSKAYEITKAARKAGRGITAELVQAALDEKVTANEVRALAHAQYELKDAAQPKGKYVDMGGFYADEEMYELFKETVKLTIKLLDLPNTMPDWLKRQKIVLAWAAEFNQTHYAEVYGQELFEHDNVKSLDPA